MVARAAETHIRAFTLASYRLATSGSPIRLMEKNEKSTKRLKRIDEKIVANTKAPIVARG